MKSSAPAGPGNREDGAPRKRPKRRPKLSEPERARLLARETQECGPGTLALRVMVLSEVKTQGDWKALAGALDDVAAAAVSWRKRVLADVEKKGL